jgi:cbb3-type cytochrome oxidase subunit 3
MDMMTWIESAKIWSLVAVTLTFSLIVAYACWPANGRAFDEAASLPLTED